MGTMLIVNAVLLLGIASESNLIIEAASSSATSDRPVVSTTTVSKRDLTTSRNQYRQRYNAPHSSTSASSYEDSSPAGTTVNTISGPNPSQSVPYNQHQYYEDSNQRQEPRSGPSIHGERIQTTSVLPALQGGFQASPDNGYPKNSAPYTAQPSQRFQNKVANGPNSQYFANPSSYKIVSDNSRIGPPIRANSFSNSGTFPPFQKFKSVPTTTNQYPASFRDHSFDGLPKFRFNGGPIGGNSRQLSKGPYGGSPSFPASKNLEVTAPAFSPGLSSTSGFKSFDKIGQNYQYGIPTASYSSNKITHPSPAQLQNSPEVSGLVPVFDNEPALFGNGFNYQTHPSAGLNFDFSKASPTSLPDGSAPFASTIGNYQSRILPGHSSNAPLISQYKGPGSNSFGSNEFTKPNGGYQLLANQPQLHFTTRIPLKSGIDNPSVFHGKPFEEIRTDVEVINKKKPPRPDDSVEHDFDEGYKGGSSSGYYPESGINKSPERDTSFEVPTSNLFNSYDQAFGKYSKLASREEPSNEKVRPIVHESSKPVYQSIEEEDDGNRDKSSEEYRSSYNDGEAASNSYEDEEEQESRRSERHESDGSSSKEKDEDDDDDTVPYKSYGEDYEKEFEESYKKELPKNDYVHVKEVPDVEESTSESKKRPTTKSRPKTSRGATRQKSRRVVHDTREEPKEYESYTTHVYEERPKSNYRDNEGRGSKTSYTTTSSSEPPTEQSYGDKISRDRGSSRYTKKETSEARITKDEPTKSRSPPSREINRESSTREIIREAPTREINREAPIRESNREPQSRQSLYKSPRQTFSSTQRPLTLTLPTFESIESYTFPPFSSQKGGLKFARATDSYGSPTYGVQAASNREAPNEGLRYFGNGQLSRDFRGI